MRTNFFFFCLGQFKNYEFREFREFFETNYPGSGDFFTVNR